MLLAGHNGFLRHGFIATGLQCENYFYARAGSCGLHGEQQEPTSVVHLSVFEQHRGILKLNQQLVL